MSKRKHMTNEKNDKFIRITKNESKGLLKTIIGKSTNFLPFSIAFVYCKQIN